MNSTWDLVKHKVEQFGRHRNAKQNLPCSATEQECLHLRLEATWFKYLFLIKLLNFQSKMYQQHFQFLQKPAQTEIFIGPPSTPPRAVCPSWSSPCTLSLCTLTTARHPKNNSLAWLPTENPFSKDCSQLWLLPQLDNNTPEKFPASTN